MFFRNNLLIIIYFFFSVAMIFSLTLKIGSVAPRDSPWDKTLHEIAAEWKRISNGSVQLKIYPGGITGTEDDTLRKLRVGALDGMVASTLGLNKISPDLFILSLPLLIRDDNELSYVMEKMDNTYQDIMNNKGFQLVGWTKAGWMNIFSRDPVYYPKDLEKQKLGFTTGEIILTKILKELGFHLVPGDSIDWLSGLQSGRTDALILSNLVAAAFQVFPIADNMLDFPLAPLVGGIILSERSWKKIPEKYRKEFLDAAKRQIVLLDVEARELEEKALQVMVEYGLTINPAKENVIESWKTIINKVYENDGLIGSIISRDVYNEAVSYSKEYREISGSNAD